MRRVLWIFCLLLAPLLYSEESLKERLSKAQAGDYIVTEFQKTLSLLHIHTLEDHRLILEEIDLPTSSRSRVGSQWKQWVQNGAPGHTNWIMMEIDLDKGEMLESYSFTKMGWIVQEASSSFLVTLLPLTPHRLARSERRKIGPEPMDLDLDTRKVWNPKLSFNGSQIGAADFEVLRIHTPEGNSALSNKQIDLYFPLHQYSRPLPYWIQIFDNSGTKFVIKGVDTGSGMISPKSQMPKRVPEICTPIHENEKEYAFKLHSPATYKKFSLHLIDVNEVGFKPVSIPFEMHEEGRQIRSVVVPKQTLAEHLLPNHSYSFMMSLDEAPFCTFEAYDQFDVKDAEKSPSTGNAID